MPDGRLHILCLGQQRVRIHEVMDDKPYLTAAVSFVEDGDIQMHLAEQDLEVNFRTGLPVNPVEKGHIAFRTDDIEAFMKRLDDAGVSYSDFGDRAVKGWRHIFFYDPVGTVIEVHQVVGEE